MKIWNYIFISVTMMLFLQFAGFQTAFDGVFDLMNIGFDDDNNLNSTSVASSDWRNYFDVEGASGDSDDTNDTGLLALLAGIGVSVGFFLTGQSGIAIKAGVATALFFSFVPTLYYSIKQALVIGVAGWVVAILAIIFIPFTIGFFIALVEWIVGGTSD